MTDRTPWQIQKAVVFALFLREMKTRFGTRNLGVLWAILEPAAIIIVLWAMFGLAIRKTLTGVDYPVFLITGMVPFKLFNKIVTRSMDSFISNIGLFNYRQVKPFDTLVARSMAECLIYFLVFITMMGAATIGGYQTAIDNIAGLVVITCLFVWFCFSTALLCAVIGTFSDGFKSVVGIMMRPLFFASGIFFTLETIPEEYRWILLLNPILNFLELIRSHYIPGFDSAGASYLYVFSWTAVTTYVALWLYIHLKNRILASS